VFGTVPPGYCTLYNTVFFRYQIDYVSNLSTPIWTKAYHQNASKKAQGCPPSIPMTFRQKCQDAPQGSVIYVGIISAPLQATYRHGVLPKAASALTARRSISTPFSHTILTRSRILEKNSRLGFSLL
jgi:hypothetical protein